MIMMIVMMLMRVNGEDDANNKMLMMIVTMVVSMAYPSYILITELFEISVRIILMSRISLLYIIIISIKNKGIIIMNMLIISISIITIINMIINMLTINIINNMIINMLIISIIILTLTLKSRSNVLDPLFVSLTHHITQLDHHHYNLLNKYLSECYYLVVSCYLITLVNQYTVVALLALYHQVVYDIYVLQ